MRKALRAVGKASLAVALAAALGPGAARGDVRAGIDAWGRGDYAGAIAIWQADAARGDADAQFNLGEAYLLGRGVPRDLARAEALFGKAAAQGHLRAADNYGMLLFQRGEHLLAMPYIKSAADRGEPRAQYLLGLALFNGDTMPKDWVRAYALMSLAQQRGLPQAVKALAQMDEYIPLDQRRRAVALSGTIAAEAEANRARAMASEELAAAAPAAVARAPARSAAPA
ncbi:MAG: sel1 repeat family protein, partial [Sphingomonadales bacterium]|nr:sel1 repeat family protein [Sphingomonadales bacterium]